MKTPLKLLPSAACDESRDWIAAQLEASPKLTPKKLWARCDNPGWMFWLLGHLDLDRAKRIEATVEISERQAHNAAPKDWCAVAWALDAARRQARGEHNDEELESAAESAESAAMAAWSAAESAARSAARSAAMAAWSAAESAAWSAAESAARSAEMAAESADSADSAWSAERIAQCDIIRHHFPWSVVAAALEARNV